MINLLPYEDKVLIKKEYLSRLFVIIGIFFTGAIFISIVFLTPVFFLLDGYKKDLIRQLDLSFSKTEIINTQKMTLEIKELNSKINILKNSYDKINLSFIMEKIIGIKTKRIKITDLNYEGSKGEEKGKVSISGVAGERQALLVFVSLLKKEFGEENVLSPVSNLLNKKNASFSLTVLNIK